MRARSEQSARRSLAAHARHVAAHAPFYAARLLLPTRAAARRAVSAMSSATLRRFARCHARSA